MFACLSSIFYALPKVPDVVAIAPEVSKEDPDVVAIAPEVSKDDPDVVAIAIEAEYQHVEFNKTMTRLFGEILKYDAKNAVCIFYPKRFPGNLIIIESMSALEIQIRVRFPRDIKFFSGMIGTCDVRVCIEGSIYKHVGMSHGDDVLIGDYKII